VAFQAMNPGISFVDDPPLIIPDEVRRAADHMKALVVAILDLLRSGAIVARGTDPNGEFRKIARSLWNHDDFWFDSRKGDLVCKQKPMFFGLELESKSASQPEPLDEEVPGEKLFSLINRILDAEPELEEGLEKRGAVAALSRKLSARLKNRYKPSSVEKVTREVVKARKG